MIRKPAAFLIALCLLVALVPGCASPAQTPKKEEAAAPTVKPAVSAALKIAAAAPGGTYYQWAAGLSEVMKKVNLQGDVVVTGGTEANIPITNDRRCDLGLSAEPAISEGWNGTGWAKGEKYQNIRGLWMITTNPIHIYVLADSSIKTLSDLNGKILAAGAQGSSHDLNTRRLMDTLNIKPKQIVNAKTADITDMIKDKRVDASVMIAGWPVSSVTELQATNKIRLLSMSEAERDAFVKAYPVWLKCTIPGSAYGLTGDTPSLAILSTALGHKDVPADVVYKITKAVQENRDVIKAYFPGEFLPAESIVNLQIPLHPGAVKYYQEKGIKLPDSLIPPEMKSK